MEMAIPHSRSQEARLTQEEVSTHPFNDSCPADTLEDVQRPSSWGCVNGENFKLPIVNLVKDEMLFGRRQTCDFTFLGEEHLIGKSVFGLISNSHFSIHKGDLCAYLVDHSTHGTFVNGVRVDKTEPSGRRQILLQSGDTISVVSAAVGPRFQFIHFTGCSTLGIPMPDELSAKYFVTSKQLGGGATCQVYSATNKKTLKKCAVKVMKLKKQGLNSLHFIEKEIKILRSVKHEMIVKVLEVFESANHTFIAMELMSGGSLMSRLTDVKENCLDEGSVRVIAYQLLLALEYLHFNNIIHRDIKPANILMVSSNKHDNRVKLADFGLSTLVSGSKPAVTNCGTENFMAPEVCRAGKSYSAKVDIWSLGATIHMCLSDSLPKPVESHQGISKPCLLVDAPWDRISYEAKDLVQKMLLGDPEQRPSARELLDHSWFKGANFEMIKKNLPSPVGPILPPQTPKKLLPTAHCGKSEKRLSLGARPSKPYSARLPVDKEQQDSASCSRRHSVADVAKFSLGPILSNVSCSSSEKAILKESSSRSKKRLSLLPRPKPLPRV